MCFNGNPLPKFVGQWSDFETNCSCSHGIFRIHATFLSQKSKSFYDELFRQVDVSNNPEVGHYLERATKDIFVHKFPTLNK